MTWVVGWYVGILLFELDLLLTMSHPRRIHNVGIGLHFVLSRLGLCHRHDNHCGSDMVVILTI